jgi:hypothetical protein
VISHDNSNLIVVYSMSGCLIGFKTKRDPIVYVVEGERNAVIIATAGIWSVLQQHHGFRLAPPEHCNSSEQKIVAIS